MQVVISGDRLAAERLLQRVVESKAKSARLVPDEGAANSS